MEGIVVSAKSMIVFPGRSQPLLTDLALSHTWTQILRLTYDLSMCHTLVRLDCERISGILIKVHGALARYWEYCRIFLEELPETDTERREIASK